MNEMQKAYITAALWSSIDGDEPLDSNYNADDIDLETLQKMKKDCDDFEEKIMPILQKYIDEDCCKDWSDFGHDFWLTRNHHGAGFWDGDYPDKMGEELTDIAHSFGECDLYVGDDGKLYL